jgi:hypothetical protein
MSKETIWFTRKTLSFRVLVLLIFFTIITMTGNALPDNEISGQLNLESAAVYVLDAEGLVFASDFEPADNYCCQHIASCL